MNRNILLLVAVVTLGGIGAARAGQFGESESPMLLPPAIAVGMRLDTLLLGGYTAGTFDEALLGIAEDLEEDERAMVALHLDRIFGAVLPGGELPGTGRVRLAYERAGRPDGSARSIRILGAEIAVSGRVHTAYYFEAEGRPGYFDPMGRSLDSRGWVSPVESMRISSAFGLERLHPILNRMLPHTGVDLAGRPGDPVRATADGVVVTAGERGGYGLLIEIRHADGYATRYAHLSALTEGVLERSVVRGGQVIGYVGQSGTATGPHLHYEVRRRGQAIDPIALSRIRSPSLAALSDRRWLYERGIVGTLLARAPALTRPRGLRPADGS